jgi:uncharacterized YccA/Bax inhibitor family protein
MANPALQKSLSNDFTYQDSSIPMTIQGIGNKTIMLFFALLISAGATWFIVPESIVFGALLPAILVGFGLALFISFSKKTSPGLIFGYSILQGFVVSGISKIFESQYEGIISTAIAATLFVAATVFFGWRSGFIKVSDSTIKFMFFALIGYSIFMLVELFTGVFTGGNLYTSSWGWLIALVGSGLAAYMLAVDFHTINRAVEMKMPVEGEWRAAFGLMATLVWLYVELLRLIGALRRE